MHLLLNFHASFDIKQIEQTLHGLDISSFSDEYRFELAFPFSFLKDLSSKLASEKILVGSNTLCSVEHGSFTESVAAEMLTLAGAKFLLIGSPKERTKNSMKILKRKLMACIECRLSPFLCIGETLKEHDENKIEEVITSQLNDQNRHLYNETFTIVYYSHWLLNPHFKPSLEEIKKTFQRVGTIVNQQVKQCRFFLPFNPNFSSEQNRKLIQSYPSQGIFFDLVSQHQLKKVLPFLHFLKSDQAISKLSNHSFPKKNKKKKEPVMQERTISFANLTDYIKEDNQNSTSK